MDDELRNRIQKIDGLVARIRSGADPQLRDAALDLSLFERRATAPHFGDSPQHVGDHSRAGRRYIAGILCFCLTVLAVFMSRSKHNSENLVLSKEKSSRRSIYRMRGKFVGKHFIRFK